MTVNLHRVLVIIVVICVVVIFLIIFAVQSSSLPSSRYAESSTSSQKIQRAKAFVDDAGRKVLAECESSSRSRWPLRVLGRC